MTDPTLTQLMTLVEQVVRPLRTLVRKRQLREELLAHVTAVFDEEIAKTPGESAAIERVRVRFGGPTELTAAIQQSLPRSERLIGSLDALVGYRAGESTLRRATRLSLIILVVFGTLCLAVFVPQHRLHEWPLIAAAPILVFCTTFLMHWTRCALCGPTGIRWPLLGLVSAVAWLFIPILTLSLCLISRAN